MNSSTSDCNDRLFGAEFKATPCHNRVLKPPGGGSSNIFGAPDVPEASPRRRNQSHMQSSVVVGTDMATPARAKPGNNSYERLFGEPELRQPSATKNRLKSNIPIGGDEVNGKLVNGSAHNGYDTQKDGNPVTGDGYGVTNGEKASVPAGDAPAVNGTAAQAPAPAAAAAAAAQPSNTARRVPPGGFSSGLW